MIRPVLFLFFLSNAVVFGIFRNPETDKSISFDELEGNFPRSKESIENRVLESIDPSANKCDDFYQYACGGNLANNRKGLFRVAAVELYKTVLSIVRRNPILLGFYESCMNQVDSEVRLSVKIKNTLEAVDKAKSVQQIMKLIGGAAKVTPVNPFVHNMQLFPFLRDGSRKGQLYFDFGLVGGDDAEDIALKILKNEKLLSVDEIAAISKDAKLLPLVKIKETKKFDENDIDGMTVTDRQITVETIVKAFPNAVGPMLKQFFSGRKLYELILDSRIDFVSIARIEGYLAKADIEAVKQIVKYAMASTVAALYPVFRSNKGSDNAMVCLRKTMSSLSDEVGRDYVKLVLTKQTEISARTMINNIIQEAKIVLGEQNSTLDEATRKDFGKKINNVNVHIGGQKKVGNYKKIDFAGNNILTNLIEISRITNQRILNSIGKKVDSYDIIEAAQVNAFYHPLYNDMFIPAGILQSPLFATDYPVAIQYSVIGYVLAHELSHSVDPKCLRVNHYGEIRDDWYTSPAAKVVLERNAKCYADEYSKFAVIGKKGQLIGYVDGKKTVGENVADSGLQLSYSAFIKTGNKESFGNFTAEQLFFLTSAQVWCDDISDELAAYLLKNDVHSPSKARVNGVLMHNAHFAQAFNCPVGSTMNPKSKCNWWGKP